MIIDGLLGRLENVRKSSYGSNHWRARCPSHKSRSRTLSISETEDGRVLIHCFAGCSLQEVLQAVGLPSGYLTPRKLTEASLKPVRQPWGHETLVQMRKELLIALLVLGDVEHDRKVSPVDAKRAGHAANSLAKWLRAVEE